MDTESLAQIRQIVTAATEAVEVRLREQIEGVQRQTGVLIEDLDHKLTLIVESQQSLREHIQDIRSEVRGESEETRALLRLSYQQLHQRDPLPFGSSTSPSPP